MGLGVWGGLGLRFKVFFGFKVLGLRFKVVGCRLSVVGCRL